MRHSTRLLRSALITIGSAITAEAALGAVGWLTPAAVTALWIAGVVAVVAMAWRSRDRAAAGAAEPSDPVGPADAALAVAIVAALALRLWTGREKASFLYDTLSFHLHFPVAWMHSGHLVVVPAVFGDVAPAYNPSNAELIFHLLMAPLHSDYLAQCGQIVFAALAALAILSTVREMGGSRPAGLGAALAFLLIPEVWQQIPTAMVDLALAAGLLACLPFLVRLARAPARSDILALALAWGFFAGTKFVAVAFSLPLVAWAAAALVRHRGAIPPASRTAALTVAALAIFVAAGGFWYLRNLALAGNPIFPVTLRVGGIEVFDGLYDTATMRAWDYHVPIADFGALASMLRDAGLGLVAAGLVALAVLRRTALPVVAIALLTIFWAVVPYQHSRFLFPLLGVAAVAIGVAASRLPPRAGAALIAVATLGSVMEFPTAERLGVLAAAGVGGLGAWKIGIVWRRRVLPVAVAALALAIGAGFPAYRSTFPGYAVGDDDLDRAWAWIWDHVRGQAIAYTGVNLPFPLAGRDLANRVEYVNVAGSAEARVHEFQGGQATTAEPAPYRRNARYETWIGNLDVRRIDWLFVSSLYPIVARTIAHDAEGFPIERTWADRHPERFRLRHASDGVRIYGIVR